jgi:hypothetical protein
MSDASPPVTLEFLARQQTTILSELGALRDDVNVLTSIVMRQDATLTALLTEIRAMHTQHARFGNRLRAVEERLP